MRVLCSVGWLNETSGSRLTVGISATLTELSHIISKTEVVIVF
jgi:hypothetical protein